MYQREKMIRAARSDLASLFRELDTSARGLTAGEADRRRRQKKAVAQRKGKKDTALLRLKKAFLNPFTVTLLFLAVISFVANHWVRPSGQRGMYSSAVLLAMVLLSGGIRLFQEGKSRRASEQMERLSKSTVRVRRDGSLLRIPAEGLAEGDYVYLRPGSRVPADIRLTDTTELCVSQAALTGESGILAKNSRTYKDKAAIPVLQYPNLVFMGSAVISGKGEGLVIAAGDDTLYGSAGVNKEQKQDSFEKGANSITGVLLRFMLVLVPVVFAISGVTRNDWREAFLFAVAAAVGLIPELLPMVITACLARGSVRMSKKKTIVKDINFMQGFGSMDILCMDKTGTLTREKILLEYYMDILGNESGRVLDYGYLNSFWHSGVKNSIDEAILKCREMPGREQYFEALEKEYRGICEVPFDYERKCVSVLLSDASGRQELILKGDPGEVLKRCSGAEYKGAIIPVTRESAASMNEVIGEMLEDGMKVLAVARREYRAPVRPTITEERDMILLGYLAFFDGPKASAAEAVRKLKELNVRAKLLTGDHREVAVSICRRVGLDCSRVLTGRELEGLSDTGLRAAAEYTEVFAELTPGQKAHIIHILKENGHTIGFLGNGMNDIPALGEADVGISVESAVDAARDAADVILLEKDLKVLEAGILEGRKTFLNMSKYIRITASSNFGNIFSIVCAGVFLPFLPMTAVQILLLNLLYDVLCIVLPWDRVDEEDCRRPREWSGRTLGRFMGWFGPISSLFDLLTFAFLYFVLCPMATGGVLFHQLTDPALATRYIALFQTGWFLESMWSQVLILQMLRTEKLPFVRSRPARGVVGLSLLGIVLFSAVTVTPLGAYLGMTAMPGFYYGFLLVTVVCYMLLTTLVKRRYVKKYRELI